MSGFASVMPPSETERRGSSRRKTVRWSSGRCRSPHWPSATAMRLAGGRRGRDRERDRRDRRRVPCEGLPEDTRGAGAAQCGHRHWGKLTQCRRGILGRHGGRYDAPIAQGVRDGRHRPRGGRRGRSGRRGQASGRRSSRAHEGDHRAGRDALGARGDTLTVGPPSMLDASGVVVSLSAPPRRIVSLIPSITEILFALGVGEAVVGCTIFCTEPRDGVAGKTKVGGEKTPKLELIRELGADLVIANIEENVREHIETLRAWGIAVYVTYPR